MNTGLLSIPTWLFEYLSDPDLAYILVYSKKDNLIGCFLTHLKTFSIREDNNLHYRIIRYKELDSPTECLGCTLEKTQGWIFIQRDLETFLCLGCLQGH